MVSLVRVRLWCLCRLWMWVLRKCVLLCGVLVVFGGDGWGMWWGFGCVCGILGVGLGFVEGVVVVLFRCFRWF